MVTAPTTSLVNCTPISKGVPEPFCVKLGIELLANSSTGFGVGRKTTSTQ